MKNNILDAYPLSPLQSGFLFQSLYEKDSDAYFVQSVEHLKNVKPNLLKEAWNVVANRYDILKTGILWKNLEEPISYVLDHIEITFEIQDLRNIENQEEKLEEFVKSERKKGFDLTKAPLMRVALIQIRDTEHVMIWSSHHIILDGWSGAIVLGEVFQVYGQLLLKDVRKLKSRRPYKDYIGWIKRQDEKKAEEFWKGYLRNIESPTQLSFKGIVEIDNADYREQVCELEEVETIKLQEFCANNNLTINTLLIGALGTVFSKYLNQKEIVIGMTTSGRGINLSGIENMIGLFINTLPVRMNGDDKVAIDYLISLQKEIQELNECCYMSLADLLKWSGYGKDLFNILFIYENYPVDESLYDSNDIEIIEAKAIEKTEYPLSISAYVMKNKLMLKYSYQTEHFNQETIERMSNHLIEVLKKVIATPLKEINRLEILTEEEKQQLLVDWNDTASEYPKDKCVHELFEAQAERSPDATAIVYDDKHLTYRELNERSNQLANYLRKNGVIADALVAICVDRSLEMIIGIMGILKSGGAYVPLDPTYPEDRLKYMMVDSGAKLVITKEYFENEEISKESTDNLVKITSPQNLAYVIYTSGSTGKPKGVQISHQNLINRLWWMEKQYELQKTDKILQRTVLSFDLAGWEIFWPLLKQSMEVLLPSESQKDPAEISKIMRKHLITISNFVPSLLKAFNENSGFEGLQSMRLIVSGGELLPFDTYHKVRNKTGLCAQNGYGPTEVTLDAAYFIEELRNSIGETVPIGRPISNVQIYILDDNQNPVSRGASGEIYIGGVGLARGYLNRPDLTAEKFMANPFGNGERLYRTGDLGRYLADGNIEFLGRIDNQVKIRGFRIELGEIESAINESEDVKTSVVLAREDSDGNKHLIAYVGLKSFGNLEESYRFETQTKDSISVFTGERVASLVESIRNSISKTLPEYMIPSYFIVLDKIPLTPNGKTDSKLLLTLDTEKRLSLHEYVAPRTEVEKKLCEIWQDILHLNKVGINDNFFKIGGDSILAIRIISKIKSVFKVDIPIKSLFEYSTISKLAEDIKKYGINEKIPPLVAQERSKNIPLSFAQQRLWVIDKLLSEKALYNIPFSLRFVGGLDYEALEGAINRLIERHESFRTNFFETEEGEGYQVISPEWKFKLIVENISEKDIDKTAKEEAESPFHLTYDRLLRVRLLKIGNEDHVLLITMHHIISDGWSMPIFLDELRKLYNNQNIILPKLPITYTDYAIWQRSWLKDDVLENQLNYWKEHLQGIPKQIDLPYDYQRPTEMTYAGGRVDFELEKETYHGILKLAEETNTTVFMLIFAAVNCLLHKYTHQDDIVIGTPIANRHYRETEGLIGFFVNTLALKTHFDKGMTFDAVLEQVKKSVLSGYEHQNISFEYLVDKLNVERRLNVNPLFQVMMSAGKSVGARRKFVGIEEKGISSDYAISKFDLEIDALEEEGRLYISIGYSKELFKRETIERMSSHLQNLFKEISVNPGVIIDRADVLTLEEKQQLLVDWNDTASEYPKDKCIHELFEEQAEKSPDAIAVVFEDKYLTYSEFNARSNQLANYLRKGGVIADTLVAICVNRSLEMIIGIMGILKSGGAYVPLDPTYPEDRLNYTLVDSGAKLVITKEYFENEEIVKEIRKESTENLVKITSPQNLAYVIYTSGSTGKPKGVPIEHAGIFDRILYLLSLYKITTNDVVLFQSSYSFDMSLEEFLLGLSGGARVVLLKEINSFLFINSLKHQCITHLNIIPEVFNALSNSYEKNIFGSDLKIAAFGGSSFDSSVLTKFNKSCVEIFNLYGPTEVSVDSSVLKCDYHDSNSMLIGRPISNTQIYILDSEQHPVSVGVSGEIYIGGIGLARGYLNRPDLTAEKFIANPFGNGGRLYRTGDLGKYLLDGNIEFLGRIDNQVKIRGFRIELREIESAINTCEDIRTSVVLVREDIKRNKQLIAYVVPKSVNKLEKSYKFETQTKEEIYSYTGNNAAAIVDNVRNQISQTLPEHMIPSYFVLLQKIPLTPNGKTDMKLLLTLDTGKRLHVDKYVSPRTEIEKKLCEIWEDVLHLEKVGINDNFFKIGGHSLLAMRIISKIRAKLNISVPLKKLFECPTISNLVVDVKESRLAEKIPPLVTQEKSEFIPLSFAQQRLWVIDKLLPEKAIYNIPCSMRLVGGLDYASLERAINRLIERHESFRTNFFETTEGEGQQRISPKWKFKLIIENISEKDKSIEKIAKEEAEYPFNLTNDRLLRVRLLRIGSEDHVLLITMHHIISDGWSTSIFMDELRELYNDQNVVLPKLPITYADYALWQRSWLKDDMLENQLNYWKNYLRNAPVRLDLPFDYQRPTEMTYAGGRIGFELKMTVYDEVLKLAKETNTTVFIVMFAVVNCLLHRYTHQNDIVIGTPIANRHYRETEGLVGFFVNTLAIKTHFDKDMTLIDVLNEVKKSVTDGYENQDIPFEYLVDKLNVERQLNVNPLFQVMITVGKEGIERKSFKNLEEREILFNYAISKFDLEFDAFEEEGHFYVSIGYSKELFKRETIERMSNHLKELLKEISVNPNTIIDRLIILTSEEKQQLLVDWNNTAADYPKDKCIHELFEEQVEKNPDAVAVVYEDKHLTYRELNERSNQLANYLRKHGVTADTLVAICIDRSLEMIIGIMGILKSGGAYVPLDPTYPEDRLKYMMVDSGAKLVITKEYFENEEISKESTENLVKITSPQNLAYVIYTSGSTGKPKGVQINHDGFVNRITWMQNEYKLSKEDKILQKTAVSFDVAGWEFFWAISYGAELIILEPEAHKDPSMINEAIYKYDVTTIHFVPSMLRNYVNSIGSLEKIKHLITSGEALSADLFNNCDQRINNLYGPTEASIDVTHYSGFGEKFDASLVPIGHPISNIQMYILDDNQNLVPLGVSGEICIGGIGLARGYLNRPDLTAEKFMANPFGNGDRLYRTGDLGRYLADGNIEFLGRIDNQVKIRGFRIELGEIESAINDCADIRTSVVLAKEDSDGNKQLVTYIVPKSVNDLEESYGFETQTRDSISVFTGDKVAGIVENIRNKISQTLPEYMIPSYFVLLDKIPLTPNGKIDGKLLLTLETGKRLNVNEYVVPRTEVEKKLCEIWKDVLHLNQVGINDNFFKIGGDSMLAIQLISKAKKNGLMFSAKDVFTYSTINKLATFVKYDVISKRIYNPFSIDFNNKFEPYTIFNNNEHFKGTIFLLPPGHAHAEAYFNNIVKFLPNDIRSIVFNNYELFLEENKLQKEIMSTTYEIIAGLYCKYVELFTEKTAILIGWSWGGKIAFEIAKRLLQAEKHVRLICIDTYFDNAIECEKRFSIKHDKDSPYRKYWPLKGDFTGKNMQYYLLKATNVNPGLEGETYDFWFDCVKNKPDNNFSAVASGCKTNIELFDIDHFDFLNDDRNVFRIIEIIKEILLEESA